MASRVDPSIFHSEEMSLCRILVKKEATYPCIYELGEVGLVHFNNLNMGKSPARLKFKENIAEYNELLEILRTLRRQIEMADIDLPDLQSSDELSALNDREMIELRGLIRNMNAEIRDITTSYQELRKEYLNALEACEVFRNADAFISSGSMLAMSQSMEKGFLIDASDVERRNKRKSDGIRLSYLTGTIPIENYFTFERVLFRVCMGYFLLRHSDITLEKDEKKIIFIIFFHGPGLEAKVRKICNAFSTSLYHCPESSYERLKQMMSLETRLEDLQIVIEQSDYHRRRLLSTAAGELPKWVVKIKKAVAVYVVMNQMAMDESEHYLVAECWIPTSDLPLIHQALNRTVRTSVSSVPPILTKIKRKGACPPTYNRTNCFTKGFQTLIDAYGVGDYRELSPVPFTTVTFPFLFAVMFGDIGHGLLVTLFACWMLFDEKRAGKKLIPNEIGKIIFDGRYVVVSMGLFSMFIGVMYNEMFAKALTIFQPAWKISFNESTVLSNKMLQLDPATAYRQDPYIFGIDPVWKLSGENAIVTLNSLKMKIAIILGVLHMYFGLGLAVWNHIFFRNYVDLLCICIPEMIFFSLFFYLIMLIFLKWSWYSAVNPVPYTTSCAPSILITFIDMVLFKDAHTAQRGCQKSAHQSMYAHQRSFQKFLMYIALSCVPIIMLSKPLYLIWKKRRRSLKQTHRFTNGGAPGGKINILNDAKLNGTENEFKVQILQPDEDEESSSSSYLSDDDGDDAPIAQDMEEQDLSVSDAFIIQSIRTMEIVLGTVSHTASYLRLWALSLAHGQLSEVLWLMILRIGFQTREEIIIGGFMLAFTFLAWSFLTVSILILMEGLSSFLHTLRLHWVEFQSKFYSGNGIGFQPFTFGGISQRVNE